MSVDGWVDLLRLWGIECLIVIFFVMAIVGSEIVHCFIGREYGKPRLALDILFLCFGNVVLSRNVIPFPLVF